MRRRQHEATLWMPDVVHFFRENYPVERSALIYTICTTQTLLFTMK